MGVEELKLVLQTLSGLADGAKEGFIWWLLVTEVFPRLIVVFCVGLLVTLAWKIAHLVADYNTTESRLEKAVTDIAGLMDQYVGSRPYSQYELNKLVQAVNDLKRGRK